MSKGERIHVATRKGLFTLERSGMSQWTIIRSSFIGDPVTIVLRRPRVTARSTPRLTSVTSGSSCDRSADGGETWEEVAGVRASRRNRPDGLDATQTGSVGAPDLGARAGRRRTSPACCGPARFPAACSAPSDRGETWQLVDSLWNRPERAKWFGGGYDDPGIHSICVDPRDSQQHRRRCFLRGRLGHRGRRRAAGIAGPRACTPSTCRPSGAKIPTIQDPHRVVQCPAAPDALWVQHHNGVFRSTDGGRAAGREITNDPAVQLRFRRRGSSGRARTRPGSCPAVKDECRIPVDGKVVVARTRDGGESFDVLTPRAAAAARLRPGLPPRAGHRRHGRPTGHGIDHRQPVDHRGRRRRMGRHLDPPATDLPGPLRLAAM